VLLEGVCGIGKTLAALEYGRAADKTVVITTDVHQQTRQFNQEARTTNPTEPLRAVVFRSKGSMCHINIDYLNPATSDMFGEARIIRNGDSVAVADIQIHDSDGVDLATARGAYKTGGHDGGSAWSDEPDMASFLGNTSREE
jgi:Rad3-related DNA helicase